MAQRTSPYMGAALALLVAACSVGDPATDRAGNPREATVVSIGTEEIGDAAAAMLDLFENRVDALSDGAIRVERRLGAVGGGTAWDQRAIEKAANGEFDGVIARAGAWHTGGVTTLDLLQLPGVVDTDAQADRLVRDDEAVAGLLAGLSEVGFTGLGIYPEAPRYLMLLDGTDDFSPSALAGREVRAPASETVFDQLSAMGMQPVDIDPADFLDAVTSGRVTATEGHLARVAITTTAAGDSSAAVAVNLPLYTKFLVLAIRDGAVPSDVMEVLRQAARTTVDPFLEGRQRERGSAAQACAAGGSLVEVPDADRLALLASVQPVIDAVAAGPNGDLLAEVRNVAGNAGREALACSASPSSTETSSEALRTSPDRFAGVRHDVRIASGCAPSGCHDDTPQREPK